MPHFLLIFALLCSGLAQAGWELDNSNSQLNFISTKKGNIGEVHRFSRMQGSVQENQAELTVELDSVDTRIGIRNERMREFLFETGLYPAAKISTNVNLAELEAMQPGSMSTSITEVILSLHGKTSTLPVELGIVRLGKDRVLVYSRAPVIIRADQFGLLPGIEKLKALAGLPSISSAVPVSFMLTFQRN